MNEASLDDEFDVTRDEDGNVASAVRRDGTAAMFVARQGSESTASCLARFEFDGDRLELRGQIDHESEVVRLEVHAADLNYSIQADFSKYDLLHVAEISGEIQGRPIVGIYDPVARHTTAAIDLDYWLPRRLHPKLGLVAPILNAERNRYRQMEARYQVLIDETILHSRWRAIGKAGCWGMGSMMGAAVCMSTGGIGCLVGAFVFGGTASICDQLIDRHDK